MTVRPRSTLENLHAYIPGKSIQDIAHQHGVSHPVKLASNENPLGCALNAHDLDACIQQAHYYPHQASAALWDRLEDVHRVNRAQLLVGNGSDELIQLIGLTYFKPGDEVIVAEHTFSVYGSVATMMDAQIVSVPMAQLTHDLDRMAHAITPKTTCIFVCNPNNPTGTMRSFKDIEAFVHQVPSHVLIVIDEAYMEYASDTTRPDHLGDWIQRHDNVLFLRTFSKYYGLAGFRLGVAMGHDTMIQTLNKVRPPFNVNSIALAAGAKVFEKTAYLRETLQVNRDGYAQLMDFFNEVGLEVCASSANFLCVNMGAIDAAAFCDAMCEKGVIIRGLRSFGLPHHVRMTIGTHPQNQQAIDAMRMCLKELS